MDVKRRYSGGLQSQASGAAVHVLVGIFASMHDIERELRESFFTPAEERYLESVLCIVAIFLDPRLLLPKTHNSKLDRITDEKSKQVT